MLAQGTLERLQQYDWPGNVRERENVVERDLNGVLRGHLLQTLRTTKGRIQGHTSAAALLGMHPNTLRHRLRKLGIPFGRLGRQDGEAATMP